MSRCTKITTTQKKEALAYYLTNRHEVPKFKKKLSKSVKSYRCSKNGERNTIVDKLRRFRQYVSKAFLKNSNNIIGRTAF